MVLLTLMALFNSLQAFLSHEMRNPIHAILNTAKMMSLDIDDCCPKMEFGETVKNIVSNCEYMVELLSNGKRLVFLFTHYA